MKFIDILNRSFLTGCLILPLMKLVTLRSKTIENSSEQVSNEPNNYPRIQVTVKKLDPENKLIFVLHKAEYDQKFGLY